MPIRSLVAVAAGGPEDVALLTAAADLAARLGASLSVTPAFPDVAAGFLSYGASLGQAQVAELAARLAESQKEAQAELEKAARAAAAGAGLSEPIAVDRRELLPAVALTRAAALADGVVFHAGSLAKSGEMRALFAEALISMRAPILLLKNDALPLKTVGVAWDGSGQAGRAVRAASAFLALAEKVVVFTNVDDDELDQAAAEDSRLRKDLARRGVKNLAFGAVKGANIAASLLEAARAEGCDLLVAGAYGRPRLQELVLGGSTRSFVSAEGPPNLFLAH